MNKVLVTMLQCTIGIHKSNWHLMLFSALWAYRTLVKNATKFFPFPLVYGLEATLLIECEIPSLKLVVELLQTLRQKKSVSFTYKGWMKPAALLLWLLKHTKSGSKLILTNQLPLILSLKEISSSCMTKLTIS